MTHRPLAQRMAAWLMVALLALVVGEPLRVHECPMHLRSLAVTAGSGSEGVHGDHAPARHLSAHAADAAGVSGHDGAQGPAHEGDHRCDCLGACCTVAPVAAPRVDAVRTRVARVATPPAAPGAPLAAVPTGEHTLPFAIGPPTGV